MSGSRLAEPEAHAEEQSAAFPAAAASPAEPDDSKLAAEYARVDVAQIESARERVRARMREACEPLLKDKIESGDFDLVVLGPEEPYRGAWEYPDGSPRMEYLVSEVNAQGAQHKVAHMRPQDDPLVHALWNEQNWLYERKLELQKAAQKP